jgi:hypothetical protein
MDPDSACFVIGLQDASKVFLLSFFECTHTSSFKDKKVIKKSQNNRNQGFSYYFCLMMEGSEAGSVPLTNRSVFAGFRIRIDLMRIRIRIQNFSNCGSGFRITDPDPGFDDLKLKKNLQLEI